MTDRELMQQAFEALEWHIKGRPYVPLRTQKAFTALRERLAQPEQEAPSPSVDAHNRMLRQQLEAEWVALQEIKRNYRSQPQQEHVIDCPRCGHCCPQTKGES